MRIKRELVAVAALILICSCSPTENGSRQNGPLALPSATSEGHFNVVVETSAGEHSVNSYDANTGKIERVGSNQEAEPFLPIPLNEGFLAHHSSTDSSLVKIPAWLLSERQSSGTIVAAKPLALLQYSLSNKEIESFLMIPAEDSLDYYQINTFEDFSINHDAIKYAFEYWLRHRKGVGSVSRIRWGDEVEAKLRLVDILNN